MKRYQYFLLLLAVPMICQSMDEGAAVGRRILPPVEGQVTMHTGDILPRLMQEIKPYRSDPQAMHDHLEVRLKGLGEQMPMGKDLNDINMQAFTKLAGKLREQSIAKDPVKVRRVIKYGVPVEAAPRRVDPEGSLAVGQGRKPVRPMERQQVVDPLRMQVASRLAQEAQPFHGDDEKMKDFFTRELARHGVTMEHYNFNNALEQLVDARVKEYRRNQKA